MCPLIPRVVQMVPTEQLRAAYRALKRTADRDRDETSRLHAMSALGYLDSAIRGQLFPGNGSGGGWGGESVPSGHHPGINML